MLASTQILDRYGGENSQMKLAFSIAATAHLLFVSQFSDAYTADPYDGEWTGSAKGTSDRRCKPADVTLTVHGKVVTGQAKFETDIANIYGTVREDGTFGATIGFRPLAGKFTQDEAEGSFSNAGCAWNILLKRTK